MVRIEKGKAANGGSEAAALCLRDKQRVGIAQAILGDPDVIILDEPTVGLDPLQIIEIRDLIKKLGEKHTVIFSSHILSEVQVVCEEVLIISGGKLVDFEKITPEVNLEEKFIRLTGGAPEEETSEVSEPEEKEEKI